VAISDIARKLWHQLGGERQRVDELRWAGPEVALPSVFRVTEFASACIGVATLTAAQLTRASGGVTELPVIQSGWAAALFRSERLLRRDGEAPRLWDPVSGYYRCADDRWIQLHCNFPHHRAGVVSLLQCEDSREAVEEAIATGWPAERLEQSLADVGMCAAMLRSSAEWGTHPQGAAVAGLPLLEISRIGEAPARRAPTGRPLAGVKVLDLTRIIAGPTCGRVLAQHGAEVLRVGAAHVPTVETCVMDMGFGKQATHVDLRCTAGRQTMESLLDSADVIVQGYRPGALEALGFGREEIARRWPGIVHVSLSAYSHVGPWGQRRGFDSLVQTASGIGAAGAAAAGVEGTRPLPCQALDHGTGWLLAAATMTAVAKQRSAGGTWMVRGSLAQTGRFLTELGTVDHIDHPGPTDEDDAAYLTDATSPFGRLTHVRPLGRLDGPTVYDSGSVPVGTDPPVWRT